MDGTIDNAIHRLIFTTPAAQRIVLHRLAQAADFNAVPPAKPHPSPLLLDSDEISGRMIIHEQLRGMNRDVQRHRIQAEQASRRSMQRDKNNRGRA
ncbi:hypothetical protein [Rhizobium sp. R634]|uniref:hypothetical protein n=1 Tax=Rhizobium sp. R634 TaxID=1764274 RepID=UPI00112FF5A2|nr:hypothetical protein [Rhizobium sp. R634]